MKTKALNDILKFLIGLSLLIILNQFAGQFFFRLDLTEEKRFSIKPATKNTLKNLDDKIYVDVYLDGELNSAFKRFQKNIRETLEEFVIHSNGKVEYNFIDPSLAISTQARNEFIANLAAKGLQPTNIIDNQDGNRVEKLIVPGAIINYQGVEKAVMLLKGTQGEKQLNNSIENIEYNLISAIHQLTSIGRKKIAFIQGHDETDSLDIISIQNTLFNFYDIREINIKDEKSLDGIHAAIISKPLQKWPEKDKFYLDQYIIKGGKVIFLLDRNDAEMTKANTENNFSFPIESGLEDMLFKYGARLNQDLIQDNNAAVYPIVIGNYGDGQTQIAPIPWPFFPVFNHYGEHIISKNLDATLGRFAGTIDTVKAIGIKKTPLIMTSPYSRTITTPAEVTIASLRKNLNPESLNQSFLPVAYLLEGKFTSVYKNRFLPDGISNQNFVEIDKKGKIIVVADGDFITNDRDMESGGPLALGKYNFQPNLKYANEDFILNAVAYLVDEEGIITARNKEISIRPLDSIKIKAEKVYWQVLNIGLPLLIIFITGLILHQVRKHQYGRKHQND